MNLKFILFFVVFINPLIGYCQVNKPTNKQVVLAGKIVNQKGFTSFDFIKGYFDKRGYSKQVNFSSTIDSYGNFKTILELQYPGSVGLSYNDSYFSVIVHPGDSVFMVIDNNAIGLSNFVRFFGDASEMNNKSYLFSLGMDSIVKGVHTYERYKTDSPSKFRYFVDSLHNKTVEYKNSFIKRFRLDKELKDWIDMKVLDNYTSSLFCYPNEHCLQNRIRNRDFDLGNDYFSFIDSIPVLRPEYLINTDISSFLPNYYLGLFVQWKVDESNKWNRGDPKRDSLLIDGILKYSKHDDLLRQMLLNEFFSWKLNDLDTAFYINHLPILKQYIHEPFLFEPLEIQFNELRRNLLKPIETSNAFIKNIKNSDVVSLLDTLRKNNVGKVVYVDIWATWCGPCRAEMQYSKDLYRKYKDKDVVFSYLCIDSEKENWNALLLELNLPGIQFYCDKITSANIRTDLKVSGIPHYMLFDKQGNIIGSGFELRPSGDIIEKKIDELLEDKK